MQDHKTVLSRGQLRFISHITPGDIAVNKGIKHTRRGRTPYAQAKRTLVAEIRETYCGGPLPYRVRIFIHIHGSGIDSDAPIKGVLDALKTARVIEDDGPKWVKASGAEHVDGGRVGLTIFIHEAHRKVLDDASTVH